MDTAVITAVSTRDEVFGRLSGFVAEIIGSDVAEEIGILPESVFSQDFEMDSIEIVAFAEKVKREYGGRVDFISWLSGMELQQIYLLSMEQVVDFIVSGSDAGS